MKHFVPPAATLLAVFSSLVLPCSAFQTRVIRPELGQGIDDPHAHATHPAIKSGKQPNRPAADNGEIDQWVGFGHRGPVY